MITPDRAVAVLWSYIAVAAIAWTYGYVCRVWIERRTREGEALFARPDIEVDLRHIDDAYDWAIDGECVPEATR